MEPLYFLTRLVVGLWLTAPPEVRPFVLTRIPAGDRCARAHWPFSPRSPATSQLRIVTRSILVTDGEERSSLAAVRFSGPRGTPRHVCSISGKSIAGASRHAVEERRVNPPSRTRPPRR